MATLRHIPDWAWAVARRHAGLADDCGENIFGDAKPLRMKRFHLAELAELAERESPNNHEEYLRGALHGWDKGYDWRPEGVSDTYWDGVRAGAKEYHTYSEWAEHGLPKWKQPPLTAHTYSESDYKNLPVRLRMPRCCRW